MSIRPGGEMAVPVDLFTFLQAELKPLTGRFKIEAAEFNFLADGTIESEWLNSHNLNVIAADNGVECIDERPPAPFGSIPRASAKFPGASLGPAILEAVETRRPVAEILHGKLDKGESVFLHDDAHHHRGWPTGGKDSGCGANDHLPEITARFLTMTRGLTDEEAVNLAQQLVGSQTGGDRIRELIKSGSRIVATYAGEHTGRRLVVNTLPGRTLDHLNPEGERSFVVDAGSAIDPIQMAKLAAATADVLLPSGEQIKLAILRPGK